MVHGHAEGQCAVERLTVSLVAHLHVEIEVVASAGDVLVAIVEDAQDAKLPVIKPEVVTAWIVIADSAESHLPAVGLQYVRSY